MQKIPLNELNKIVEKFNNSEDLNKSFSEKIKNILNQAIKKKNQAILVVSGGKTPQKLFNELSNLDLEWQKVIILLADERWVDNNHSDSNEKLIKDYLLINKANQANFINYYNNKFKSVFEAQDELNNKIKHLNKFDILILGMGEDGHTASLFPCSEELKLALSENAKDLLAIKPKTANYDRISLSKKRLLNSENIFLHLVGENKLKTLNLALELKDETKMPIYGFLNDFNNLKIMYSINY